MYGRVRSFVRAPTEPDAQISTFVKYTLFFLNFLFWLAGLFLVAVGTWALVTKYQERIKVVTSAWNYFFDVSLILGVIGLVVVVISTLGCIGALRENTCLLKAYICILVVIIVCFLLIAIIGLFFYSSFTKAIKEKMTVDWIKAYFEDANIRDLTDYVQETFECCGMSDESYLDWHQNPYYSCRDFNPDFRRCDVPHTCCHREIRQRSSLDNFMCGKTMQLKPISEASRLIRTEGCITALQSWAKSSMFFCIAVALIVMLLPIALIFLSALLVIQINAVKSQWSRDGASPASSTVPITRSTYDGGPGGGGGPRRHHHNTRVAPRQPIMVLPKPDYPMDDDDMRMPRRGGPRSTPYRGHTMYP